MNVINWFITPNQHILKGDVVLSTEEFLQRVDNKKNKVDISGLIYEYKDMGVLRQVSQKNKIFTVTTKTGGKYILNTEFMDRYFVDNHYRDTIDYLKSFEAK